MRLLRWVCWTLALAISAGEAAKAPAAAAGAAANAALAEGHVLHLSTLADIDAAQATGPVALLLGRSDPHADECRGCNTVLMAMEDAAMAEGKGKVLCSLPIPAPIRLSTLFPPVLVTLSVDTLNTALRTCALRFLSC